MLKLKVTHEEQKILYQTIRFVLYFALICTLSILIWGLSSIYHKETFLEYGIIENIQFLLLLFTGCIFWAESYFLKEKGPLLLLFASLCFLAFCRELDGLFDSLLPIISWKFGFLFPILALSNLYRHRKKMRPIVFSFLKTPTFYLMFTATIICIPVAQCLGHKPMLATIMDNANDVWLARRIIEESLEIIGYFLLLLSTIECYINLTQKKS